jgi:hypothetical protein
LGCKKAIYATPEDRCGLNELATPQINVYAGVRMVELAGII